MTINTALVVGGGIGGLSAAIALSLRGVSVELIEKRPDFQTPGVGLGQPAGALRIYDGFGILEELLDTGFVYDRMNVFDPDMRLMATHRFQMGDDRVPAFCALPRAELHRMLLARAKALGVQVHLETEAVRSPDVLEGAVTFNDGRSVQYDVVLGFDGIRSAMREIMFGDMFVPRHCGYGAWRVQAERPDTVRGMDFVQGLGGKAGVIPISGDRMYLFNIRPEPDVSFDQDKMHLYLRDRLAQFGGYVGEVASSLSPDSKVVYGALEPFILPHPWHRGRLVLGGDAAHVVPPHLTAGAAMAVEDALVLARLLCEGQGTLEQRLETYGRMRFARNAFVYAFARDWMELEQSVHSAEDLERARCEYDRNLSKRILITDRFLDASPI